MTFRRIDFDERDLTAKLAKPAHYIFLIDGSTSMDGRPWRQVNEALKKFRDSILKADPDLNSNPYVKAGQRKTII